LIDAQTLQVIVHTAPSLDVIVIFHDCNYGGKRDLRL
jgi:hypothetical protein